MNNWLYGAGIAALVAFGAPGAHADPGFYLGVGFLSGSGEFEDSFAVGRTDNDTSGASFKLGYVTERANRLELSFTSIDLEFPTVKREVSGLDIDHLWTFGADALKPYLGLGIGFYTFRNSAQFFTDNRDLRGVAVNLSAGLVFEVTRDFDLEAALRIKAIESEEIQVGGVTGSWNQTMTNFLIGANLHF